MEAIRGGAGDARYLRKKHGNGHLNAAAFWVHRRQWREGKKLAVGCVCCQATNIFIVEEDIHRREVSYIVVTRCQQCISGYNRADRYGVCTLSILSRYCNTKTENVGYFWRLWRSWRHLFRFREDTSMQYRVDINEALAILCENLDTVQFSPMGGGCASQHLETKNRFVNKSKIYQPLYCAKSVMQRMLW